MNRFRLFALALVLGLGCSRENETGLAERATVTRINNLFDAIRITLIVSSNSFDLKHENWDLALATMGNRDLTLKGAMTMRSGGQSSFAMFSTNIAGWLNPEQFPNEIAIIIPDIIQKDGKKVCIAKRFDEQVVYFVMAR